MQITKALLRFLLPPLSIIDAWTDRRKFASTMLWGGGLGAIIGPILALPLGLYLFGFFGSSVPLLALNTLPGLLIVCLGLWGASVLGRFVGFLLGCAQTGTDVPHNPLEFREKILQAGLRFALFGNGVMEQFYHLFCRSVELETLDGIDLLRPAIRANTYVYFQRGGEQWLGMVNFLRISCAPKFTNWLNDDYSAQSILTALTPVPVGHHVRLCELLGRFYNLSYFNQGTAVGVITRYATVSLLNKEKLCTELDVLKDCGLLVAGTNNRTKIEMINQGFGWSTFHWQQQMPAGDLAQVVQIAKALSLFRPEEQLQIIRHRYNALKIRPVLHLLQQEQLATSAIFSQVLENSGSDIDVPACYTTAEQCGLFSDEPTNALWRAPEDEKGALSKLRKQRFFNVYNMFAQFSMGSCQINPWLKQCSLIKFDLIASGQYPSPTYEMSVVLRDVPDAWLTKENCQRILQNQNCSFIAKGLKCLQEGKITIPREGVRRVNLLGVEQGRQFFELVIASSSNAPSVAAALPALFALAPSKLGDYLELIKQKLPSFTYDQISAVNEFISKNSHVLEKISQEDFQRVFAYPEKLAVLQETLNIQSILLKPHNLSALLQCLPEIEAIKQTLEQQRNSQTLNQATFNELIAKYYQTQAREAVRWGSKEVRIGKEKAGMMEGDLSDDIFKLIATYTSENVWDKSPHQELFAALEANHCADLLEDTELEKQLIGQTDSAIEAITRLIKVVESTDVFTQFEQKGASNNSPSRVEILLRMSRPSHVWHSRDNFWLVRILREGKLLQGKKAPGNFLQVLNNVNHSDAIKQLLENKAVANCPDYFVPIISQGKYAEAINELLVAFEADFFDGNNTSSIDNLDRVIKRAPEAKEFRKILEIMKQEGLLDSDVSRQVQSNFESLFNAGPARSILDRINQHRQSGTPLTQEKFREIVILPSKNSVPQSVVVSGGSPIHTLPVRDSKKETDTSQNNDDGPLLCIIL